MNLLAWLRVVWCLAIGASLVSLFAFRSSETHGPDMVGREATGFVAPLVVALVAACVSMFVRRSRVPLSASRPLDTPLVTLLIGVVEVVLYCTVVVR